MQNDIVRLLCEARLNGLERCILILLAEVQIGQCPVADNVLRLLINCRIEALESLIRRIACDLYRTEKHQGLGVCRVGL